MQERSNGDKKSIRTRGQSLLEILFAAALFMIGVATIGFLIIDSYVSLRHSIETTKAVLLAKEGIAAAQSMGVDDFDRVSAGVYGLSLLDGRFVFVPDPDQTGKFIRTITVTDVDLETKKVESAVDWETTGARENRTTLTSYITDWRSTGGDAEFMAANTDTVELSASGTVLSGASLSNSGTEALVITGVTASWNGTARLYQITLNGSEIYATATSSGISSGTYIDTADYLLGVAAGDYALELAFDSAVETDDFILTFIIDDGSRRHILVTI